MDKFANDNLILLEFLVDNVCFEYSVQQSLKCMQGETCVAFQFLDNAPLYVSEEDFAPKMRNYADGCGGCSTVKNGKSCLFALNPKQAEECMKQFDIYVEVFRKMQPGTLPEKLVLGESLISILNLFQEMVNGFNASSDDAPIAKTLKDCFKIQNTSGELVGRIGVYIRMSTFGKLIVTQFQMNLQDKSVEFKAKEGHYLFTTKTNKPDPEKTQQIVDGRLSINNVFDIPCGKAKETPRRPCSSEPISCPRPISICPAQPRPPSSMPCDPPPQCCQPPPCPPPPCYQPQPCPPPLCAPPPPPPRPCPPQPCVQPPPFAPPPCGPPCFPPPCGPTSPCAPPPCGPPPPCGLPCPAPPPCAPPSTPCPATACAICGMCPPRTCPACGQSTPAIESPCEIYKRQMQSNTNNMEIPCAECNVNYQNPPVPPPPDCDYQEFGAEMGGNSLIIRVHKDKANVEELNNEQCCCDSGANRGKPKPAVYQVSSPSPCCCINQAQGGGGGKGTTVCPSCCPDNNAPFTFKMGGATQADNNVSLISPNNTAKDGGKLGVLADPTKEVFILRIGKKNESASKKNNMEIELCTPRGKEYKAPPKKIEMEQQCEPQLEPESKKGKKGKKEKGKKKGGKKKK